MKSLVWLVFASTLVLYSTAFKPQKMIVQTSEIAEGKEMVLKVNKGKESLQVTLLKWGSRMITMILKKERYKLRKMRAVKMLTQPLNLVNLKELRKRGARMLQSIFLIHSMAK